MIPPKKPENELGRMQFLRELHLLDTAPEKDFDDLTAIAAGICETPIALVSLVDENRQWSKSSVGLDRIKWSRDASFCGHAILNDDLFEITDTELDPRFENNPFVRGTTNFRSYLGAPLTTEEGFSLGTLCVIDTRPREFSAFQKESIRSLARQIVVQISARNQAAVILENEARLKLALDAAAMGIYDWNILDNSLSWSQKHIELWGYNEGEFDGTYQSFSQRVHPDDIKVCESEIKRCMEAKVPFSSELRVIWPDESVHWISTLGRVSYDQDGNPTRMLGVVFEITDRKNAESDAAKAQRRYQFLVEHSTDALTLLDLNLNVTYASPSLNLIEGYQPNEVLGQSFLDRIHPDDKSEIWSTIKKLPQSHGTPFGFEVRSRHKDGHWLWIEGSIINHLDDSTVGAIVVNYRDISQRQLLEEELRQSQKLDAIGQLAGGVAHDFNNILTIIAGYGSLLSMDESMNNENSDAINEIVEASERATNLTSQLLSFSRKQVIQPHELDLNKRVESLTRMLSRILGENIELKIDCAEDALPIRADEGMIDQIVLNLVVNSRDAMEESGTLTIQTGSKNLSEVESVAYSELSPGKHVWLKVTDTGTGIKSADLQKIFDPFFTTKDQGKGTGLGLATVFGNVKQHGGAVQVETEIGQGTTFEILFPEAVAEKITQPKPDQPVSLTNGNEVVLLVEDEMGVRNLVRTILTKAGYTVLEASSGRSALEVWEMNRDKIDLLLTDIVMPEGVSGLELADRLGNKVPELPIVFMSGYSADIAGRELVLEEGQNFLQKPVSRTDILTIIRRTLNSYTTEKLSLAS